MKAFIIGLAVFLVSMSFTVFQHDYNLHQQQMYNLKFAAEEVAAAASQYLLRDEYAKGQFIFNKAEGIEAAEYLLKKQLKLNDLLFPLDNNYWQERISYQIEFFDESNTLFPYLYNHSSGSFSLAITGPTVIVTIAAGKPRYRMLDNPAKALTVAAHEWENRE